MLGFHLVNLVVPEDPEALTLATPRGPWVLEKESEFPCLRAAIAGGQCAETYGILHDVSLTSGSAAVEQVTAELLPICLGASFLVGYAVTLGSSLPMSELSMLSVSNRFPRERGLLGPGACVSSAQGFRSRLEKFVEAFPSSGVVEKITVLVHHWLDAMACWSLEDLYLSATTVMQVISATESDRTNSDLSFSKGTEAAAIHVGVHPPPVGFQKMRNDLVHDGRLSGKSFKAKSHAECAALAADVLNWIDEYIHGALGLGPVECSRFAASRLEHELNAYSL